MEIIEQALIGKTGDPSVCEDSIFISDGYIAIIDGASSKSNKTYGGKKTGRIAMEVIHEALGECEFEWESAKVMSFLNEAISKWYSKEDIYDLVQTSPKERCTASIAIYSKHKREVWLLADCQAIIAGRHITNEIAVDKITSGARSMFIESELLKGKTVEDLLQDDTGRQFIEPLLERQNSFLNISGQSPFRHGALDGFWSNAEDIRNIPVENGADSIVLASDGYPELLPTLKQSEEALEKVIKEDPLMYRMYPSTKGLQKGNLSFDDRAYIRFIP